MFAPNDIIVVQIYDKQGWRDGYFYGSEQFAIIPKTGITNFTDLLGRTYYGIDNQGSKGYGSKGWSVTSTAYGVYCQSIHSDDSIAISAKYSANYTKTIDGTYHIEVYKLGFPNNESPFE